MAGDSIIVKYEADISGLKAELQEIKKQNATLTKSAEDAGKKIGQTASTGINLFSKLGGVISAAFSVGAIIQWSNTALNAYKEQEKALTQLKASLETVANEGTRAFNKLVSQAEKLQKVSIFSDEQIEQTQTMLINFGLTSKQTEILTNRIVDFASRTGKSLEESSGIFLRAIEGQTRGLIASGAKFDDTGSKVGNFNALLQATEKFAGGASTALGTQAGQLQNIANQIDDINEQTGKALSGLELAFAKTKLGFARLIEGFLNTGDIGLSIRNLFFPKDEAKKLPEELNQIKKAVDEITLKREKAFQTSLNKSLIGLSDADLKAEIKRLESLDQANTIAVKDRIDLINKELEARKKLREERNKESEKSAKEAADLQRKSFEVARDEWEKLQKDKLDLELKGYEVARDEFEKSEKDKQDFARTEFEVAREEYEKLQEDEAKVKEDAEKRKQEAIQATFDFAQNLLSQLQGLFSAQDAAEIDAINTRKDEQLKAIDEELEKLDEAHEKRKIGDKQYEAAKKKLLDKRKADEEAAAKKTKDIQRQQAEREKALTIFSIILSTAKAIAEAAATLDPVLVALAAITGAAQLAIAVATPIPQFKRGTKGKKGSGVGLVGEEGAEFIYMPHGTQVVPADRTKRYKDAINSMIDGQFEQYVYRAMIAPALREATKKMEEKRTKSFAENIANVFNTSQEGTNPYRVYDGVRMNNKELADAIARAMSKHFSNNSNDRYYH